MVIAENTEQCLIGCLLRAPVLWEKIHYLINKNYFTLAPSIKLFEIFETWAENNKKDLRELDTNDFINYLEIEFHSWLQTNNDFITKILKLIQDADHAHEKWEQYVQTLETIFCNKIFIEILDKNKQAAEKNPLNTLSLLRDSISSSVKIYESMNRTGKKYSLNDIMADKQKEILLRLDDSYKPCYCNIDSLDEILGGYYPETYNIIAARSSMGKSAFMGTISRNMVKKQKKKVAIFNLEMPNKVFIDRWASQDLNIDANLLRNPKLLTKAQREAYIKFNADFSTNYGDNLFLIDNTFYLNQIFERIISIYTTYGLDIVFIDLISNIMTIEKYQSRQMELAYISNSLFNFRKDYPIAIVAIQQQNKLTDFNNTQGNSGQSSLREAEDTYIQSDSAILIYPKIDENKTLDKKHRILTVDKNRHGLTGSTELRFISERLLFEDTTLGVKLN